MGTIDQIFQEENKRRGYTGPRTGMLTIEGTAPEQSYGASVKTGIMDDPRAKVAQFAKARFPDEPNPEKRYGMTPQGEIYFMADDGKAYMEQGGVGRALSGVSRAALPMAGGIAGMGLGGPWGGATGAMGGELLRQEWANELGDPYKNPLMRARDITLEGALGGIAPAAGGKAYQKLGANYVPEDAATVNRATMQELREASGKYFGTESLLTPAEASGSSALAKQQTQLTMAPGKAGDMMKSFYDTRKGLIDDGVETYLGVGKYADDVGMAARRGARKVVTASKLKRAAKTREFYKIADSDPIDVTNSFGTIDGFLETYQGTPTGAKLEKIKKMLTAPSGDPKNAVGQIHAAKVNLDDMAKKAMMQQENDQARVIGIVRDELVDNMDQASEAYKTARNLYRELSPEVRRIQGGVTRAIAKLKDDNLANAASKAFGKGSSSIDIIQARQMFAKVQEKDAWDDLVRQYMREVWEEVPDEQMATGRYFYKKLYGTRARKSRMRAAIGPDESDGFEQFMKVLDASGSVQKGQSITHYAGEAAKQEAQEAAPLVSRAEGIGGITGIRKWWVNMRVEQRREALARIITNPDAAKQMKQLKFKSPNSQRAAEIAAYVILAGGAEAAGEVLEIPQASTPAVTR